MDTSDMLAIQQTISLYSYTFDSGDAKGWANVFTEDAVWEFYGAGATTPATKLVGYKELSAFCERQFKNKPAGMSSMHHQSGIYFDELTSDSAKTRVMVIITLQMPNDQGRVYLTGVYYDQWKKTSQGWRLIYRGLKA